MEIFAQQAALAYMAYTPALHPAGVNPQKADESTPYEVQDKVTISREGAELYQNLAGRSEMAENDSAEGANEAGEGQESSEKPHAKESDQAKPANDLELSESEKEMVRELQARDKEVRAHEAAHMAAGGGVVKSGATFAYQQGPDGKRYAVGGEVQVDTSRESEPEATLQKMQQVKRAALAPASPSGQDRSVAAKATRIMTEAHGEIAETARAEIKGSGESGESAETESAEGLENQSDSDDSSGIGDSAGENNRNKVENAYPQAEGSNLSPEFGENTIPG